MKILADTKMQHKLNTFIVVKMVAKASKQKQTTTLLLHQIKLTKNAKLKLGLRPVIRARLNK